MAEGISGGRALRTCGMLFCILIAAAASRSQTREALGLLGHLEGTWTMTGHVMQKPVKYEAVGRWVLNGQFLSLHMIDAVHPPEYEAEVSIGVDSAHGEFVAHWLDSFGGAGARVVGLGPLSGDTVRIVYPYDEGKFRNVFTIDPENDGWTLVVESEHDGRWSVFAQYRAARRR